MDKWMAAVAAGAASIAQHFKKSKQTGDQPPSPVHSSHGSFSDKPHSPKLQPFSKKWPLRRLFRRATSKQDDGENEKGMHLGGDGIQENVEKGDFVNESLTSRSQMSFRSGKVVRPLSSLESCVMAHVEKKEYMQTVRPFLVIDGKNVINSPSFSEGKGGSFLDATLLVGLGMSFGILYSFMENKREVEKLKRLLKQKENLVRDLEDEIEMKDSLIVQELTFDGESPHSVSVSHEHDDKDSVFSNEKQNFSEIEAELEAELELLEHSMASSSLETKISNLFELDPDFEPGVAEGELRAEMLDNADDEFERGSITTTHSANYVVSATELRLRLHEVLQSQLEERIRELEAQIEAQNHKSWKDFSSSNAEDEPVVLNLSGEALEAYNDACKEFAKFDELYEEFDDDGTLQNGGDEVDLGDDDDEMKLLIKHIVEKARQGSPAVLNAHRALFLDQSLEVEKKS
ncbi:hypothetical protein SSX86_013909 [Deinandra increscens subsp. villosa]|uniref:Uncharacterized protein n=1 Tax=Deinandra increscens subsp. villosa TaxID=3103831 RepID=A0AAP0GYU0_9ASTR